MANETQENEDTREHLIDDLLDFALRSSCQFFACEGPEEPYEDMKTCCRCATVQKAMRLGLVRVAGEAYVRTEPTSMAVQAGTLEQLSAVNGQLL